MIFIFLQAQLKQPIKPAKTTPKWVKPTQLAVGGLALVPAMVLLAVAIGPGLLAVAGTALLGVGAFVSAIED